MDAKITSGNIVIEIRLSQEEYKEMTRIKGLMATDSQLQQGEYRYLGEFIKIIFAQ